MPSATPLAIQNMPRAIFGDRDAVKRMRVIHRDDVRTHRFRNRGRDDVAGRVFRGRRSGVVRQAKDLGRVSFQPLLDPFGRETRKLPEPSFIFGQFRKDLDRLCCTNPVRDSSRESSVVAGLHEQTHTPRLQDQELAGL